MGALDCIGFPPPPTSKPHPSRNNTSDDNSRRGREASLNSYDDDDDDVDLRIQIPPLSDMMVWFPPTQVILIAVA